MTVPYSPRQPAPGFPEPPGSRSPPAQPAEAAPGTSRAWSAFARRRLLELAATGGALLGAFLALIADAFAGGASPGRSGVWPPMLIGVAAGFGAGFVVGRGVYALLEWRAPTGTWRGSGVAWLLLATPGYLVAGLVGAVAAAFPAGLGMEGIAPALGGIAVTLALAWLVLAPVTLAFAPSPSGAPKVMHRRLLGFSGTGWVLVFTVLWFIGAFMAVLLVLAGLQALAPAAYDAAAEHSLLAYLMVGAWLALWIGGSAAAYRLVRRVLVARGPME